MRVWITALLVGIAVLIGTLVSKDPGYVLIAYGPYQLQTSVWMMLPLSSLLVASTACGLDHSPNAWYWAALARMAGVASD